MDTSSERRGGPEKNSVSHTFKKECVCVDVSLCVCESEREGRDCLQVRDLLRLCQIESTAKLLLM